MGSADLIFDLLWSTLRINEIGRGPYIESTSTFTYKNTTNTITTNTIAVILLVQSQVSMRLAACPGHSFHLEASIGCDTDHTGHRDVSKYNGTMGTESDSDLPVTCSLVT